MNSRRLFLRGLLVGASAPAIVKAESLMKIWTPPAPKLRGQTSTITFIDESGWHIQEMPMIIHGGINDFDDSTPPEIRARLKQWMLEEDRKRTHKPRIQSMAFTSQRVVYRS